MPADPSLADLVLPERPAEGERRRWFAAGSARLAIDVPSAARDDGAPAALHDAVLLGARDAPLARLAELCDEDFAWRPLELAEDPPDAATLDFTLAPAGAAPARVAVALPASLEARLGAAVPRAEADDAATGDAVRIAPHRPTLSLVLERTTLGDDDAARLAPGALLLLAGSFDARWRAALETGMAGELPLAVELDPSGGTMMPIASRSPAGRPASKDAAPGTTSTCTVTLADALVAPLERWARASSAREPLPLELGRGTRVSLELGGAAARAFAGELVAMRGGFGVLVDEPATDRP